MPVTREVWMGHDANVEVYLENSEGEVIGGVVLSYCFWQNFAVRAILEQTRRPVTGRSRKKITNREYEYEASVDHFYFRKSDEINLTQIFNRQQPLRLVVTLDKPHYSGVAPLENDTHTLKRAFANGFDITGQENDILIASAKFAAEEFE